MTIVALSPILNGYQSFLTNGLPNCGGYIWTYTAGTTTPLSTYTTSSGSVANTNPMILSTDGRPKQEIWLASGSAYKFVVMDSYSAPIPNATYDNISSSSSGASVSYGTTRPTPTTIGQLFLDQTLGPYGQLIICGQVSPAIWINSAGFPV